MGSVVGFPVPRIDYGMLLVLFASVSLFAKAAQMDGRSPLVWGGLSLGSWIAVTQFAIGGLAGALISQVALFVGLTAAAIVRDRKERQGSEQARADPGSPAADPAWSSSGRGEFGLERPQDPACRPARAESPRTPSLSIGDA